MGALISFPEIATSSELRGTGGKDVLVGILLPSGVIQYEDRGVATINIKTPLDLDLDLVECLPAHL